MSKGEEMFQRFTDRARRVVVLAQEEARMLDHNYIGTEHILLGLLHEGEGVAAKVLEGLGIELDAVRQQVVEMIGRGAGAPSANIPFTPRTKKVLELSLRESRELGHNYIGTEHILLALVREGEGVAAQVLLRLGADRARTRQQVRQLLHGSAGPSAPRAPVTNPLRVKGSLIADLSDQTAVLDRRLGAVERWVGVEPDVDSGDEALAAERKSLAQQVSQLSAEVERLARLLKEHGIEPGGGAA